MRRREFLAGAALTGLLWRLPRVARAERSASLHRQSLGELLDGLRKGNIDAETVSRWHGERVEALNLKLNAVIELNSHLVEQSKQRAGMRLAGLPILVKDNISTGEGLANAAGSLALATSRPESPALPVARLIKAGGVVMGKANMSEWANFRSTNSVSGWSGRGGQCRNPHALDRSPCGSSSGSAAAVAAGFAPAALGTETNGSIICPCGINGVVGMKPSHGLIPHDPLIIPIAPSQDTVGPITRTVWDAALMLEILSGQEFLESLDPGSLKGARVGIARNLFGFDHRVDELLEVQLAKLSSLGATLIDSLSVPTSSDFGADSMEVFQYEFKAGLNEYLAGLGAKAPVGSLADVLEFNRTYGQEERMFDFGQELLEKSQANGPLSEPAYKEALGRSHDVAERGLNRAFEGHDLDVLVMPSNGPAWTLDPVNGDHWEGGGCSAAAVAGFPHLTVPAGAISLLPVGLSFVGRKGDDARVLSLGHAFEQATRARIEPQFLTTLPL